MRDNTTFWKTIIYFFTKRSWKGETFNFIENGNNISNDTELCKISNYFFFSIISELKSLKGFVFKISKVKYLIRLFFFFFENTYIDVVKKVINNLNVAKSCQMNDILTKNIKMNKDIFTDFIVDYFNDCIAYDKLPGEIKNAEFISVHIKVKSVTRQVTNQQAF